MRVLRHVIGDCTPAGVADDDHRISTSLDGLGNVLGTIFIPNIKRFAGGCVPGVRDPRHARAADLALERGPPGIDVPPGGAIAAEEEHSHVQSFHIKEIARALGPLGRVSAK